MPPHFKIAARASSPMMLKLLFVGLLAGQATAYENIMDLSSIGEGSTYPTLCQNPVALVSFYAAADTYCTAKQYETGMAMMEERCLEYGETELVPRSAVAANLTAEAESRLPVYTESQLNVTVNITEPWIPEADWYAINYKTLHTFWHILNLHHIYSWSLYGFWGPILIFGVLHKLYRVSLDASRGYVYLADVETGASGPTQPVSAVFMPFVAVMAAFRKYTLAPSAMPPYHQRRFLGCTIPTRWESFVVLAFWALNIILTGVSIPAFEGNTYYNTISKQVWKYVSDRTANMCYANLPLIWMFAGRNNVLLWMTGWSFGTFNIYHRHIARIATLQAIIHSIGYTVMYLDSGASSYKTMFSRLWWTSGVIATVMMSFLVLSSFHIMRNRLYDSFLIIHIVLSVLLLVFLYHHTAIFDLEEYNYPYIIPPVAIWAFDRLMRIVRQLYCNLYVSSNRGKGLIRTQTSVQYDEQTNIITVDMIPGNAHLFCGPGQHYYMYQPFRFFGWENHPFTVGHWHEDERDGKLHLVFWVRPYNGWTKHLQLFTQKKGQGAAVSPTMFIEGPYGHSEPVHCFENMLLVAGGSGIAGVLPYLVDFVRRANRAASPDADGQTRVPTRTRHVTLIWSDRSEKFLRQIYTTILAPMVAGRHDITLMLHMTGPGCIMSSSETVAATHLGHSKTVSHTCGSSSEDVITPVTPTVPQLCEKSSGDGSSSDADRDPEKEDGSSSAVQKCPGSVHQKEAFDLKYGRPEVLPMVERMATETKNAQQRLAIMVCGPASLSDDIRVLVSRHMERNRDSIEYFEDSFGW